MTGAGFPRVALVHDWLVTWGGSESVVRSFANLFPGAPLHTSVYWPEPRVAAAFEDVEVRPTWLQRAPVRNHRLLLPLMPRAFADLRLPPVDLVLTSSHALSKAVRVPSGALHVCYCHTPTRYLWDLYGTYNRGVAGLARAPLMSWLRRTDYAAAQRVDHFIANAEVVAERIRRNYGKPATVIYPPVDVDAFASAPRRPGDYFLAGGRLVAYKRVDVAIRAANAERFRLVVFGAGPELPALRRLAGPTVEFAGAVSEERLIELAAGARAFLFPGEEDFGILPVEVQAAGCPVVAWNRGGARETILPGATGVLYDDPSPTGLVAALHGFQATSWDPDACRANARRFERDRFEAEIAAFVAGALGAPASGDVAAAGSR